MNELAKVKRAMEKAERKYETSSPVEKKRMLRKATSLQKRIDKLKGN